MMGWTTRTSIPVRRIALSIATVRIDIERSRSLPNLPNSPAPVALIPSMSNDKLRQQIAAEAARLIQSRQVSAYYDAKMRAARSLRSGWIPSDKLPENREILDQMQHRLTVQPIDGENDRFARYHLLLVPLEGVKLNPQEHPEGDALYHSLQVFDVARDAVPYDEELQLAALLHEVGRPIDPRDPVAAALESLDGFITERTAWLIGHQCEAAALREGTLGARSRRRLEASPDFDDLMLLERGDRQGRVRGVAVPEIEEALELLRELAADCGE